MATTIGQVTTKERLHRLVDELTEQEADDALRIISSQREDVDEWGSLSKWSEVLFKDTMRRLAEEERAAGSTPWERGGSR